MIAAQPYFSRHESFYPRFGWLWKAVNLSKVSPDLFSRSDATVELGVGKNMVRAIRYWALAMRLITEFPDPDRPRRNLARPTVLGDAIFGPDGFDPFLEDARTLWLLHWILLRPPSMASSWQLLIGRLPGSDFTDEDARDYILEQVAKVGGWPAIPASSVKRDVQCIAQMYAPSRRTDSVDDGIDSPFRQLGLLIPSVGDRSRLRFSYGEKPGLTPRLITMACVDFASSASEARTATVSRLTLEPGSPGLLMRLGEDDVVGALEETSRTTDGVSVTAPAGVRQLTLARDPQQIAVEILCAEFGIVHAATRVGDLFELLSTGPRAGMEAA